MTETVRVSAELVEKGFYEVDGRVMYANSPNTLVGMDTPSGMAIPAPQGARLLETVGSEGWSLRMIQIRDNMAVRLKAAEFRDNQSREKYDLLGQAILEQAEERDWCREYDEFAESWDLPTRRKNFRVTVTLTVQAQDEDSASDLVDSGLRISEYDDHVVSGPYTEIEREE